jgi:F0F1-type ATP synthase membrane subunit b/b'
MHRLSKAQHCREEAARIRDSAERFTDKKIRRQMLDIAAQYDRLAESLTFHVASTLLLSD